MKEKTCKDCFNSKDGKADINTAICCMCDGANADKFGGVCWFTPKAVASKAKRK